MAMPCMRTPEKKKPGIREGGEQTRSTERSGQRRSTSGCPWGLQALVLSAPNPYLQEDSQVLQFALAWTLVSQRRLLLLAAEGRF